MEFLIALSLGFIASGWIADQCAKKGFSTGKAFVYCTANGFALWTILFVIAVLVFGADPVKEAPMASHAGVFLGGGIVYALACGLEGHMLVSRRNREK